MEIAICAGEPSGDLLGADLITALLEIYPDATFTGIAGPKMQAAGCTSLFPMETLSVMGVAEVLPKLPQILSVRKKLIQHFIKNPPDLFIGIDSPDFTLGVEKAMKKIGVKTVHYVSPTVWAWREKRVLSIKKSTDLMLCVLPFETAVYEKYGMKAKFIGHPAAERLYNQTLHPAMGSDDSDKIGSELTIALMPGSRSMEIKYLAPLFLSVAQQLSDKHPNLKFVLPAVNYKIKDQLVPLIEEMAAKISLIMTVGGSERAMQTSDIVLCTSGTTTLEAMLLNKPMVVAYKMSAFNWWLAQRLVDVKYIAIPNLLAGEQMVPEFVQEDANIYNLSQSVESLINNPDRASIATQRYQPYCEQLAQNASQQAAMAIKDLLSS